LHFFQVIGLPLHHAKKSKKLIEIPYIGKYISHKKIALSSFLCLIFFLTFWLRTRVGGRLDSTIDSALSGKKLSLIDGCKSKDKLNYFLIISG